MKNSASTWCLKRILRGALTALVLFSSYAQATEPTPHKGYIVRFKSAIAASNLMQVSTQANGESPKVLTRDGKTLWVQSPAGFNKSTEIDLVEPNYQVSINFGRPRPNPPPPVQSAWGLKKIQADITRLSGATGSGILIAVVDSGVDASHPELAGRVDQGYDFANDRPVVIDDNGHGTHVAGTIAGKTVGVAPEARILPIKFLGPDGYGYIADAIRGIDFARAKRVHVMNHSWGGNFYSQALDASIQAARAEGIIMVAAAGNSGTNNDMNPQWPANIQGVMAVSASDTSDRLAYFSNFGNTVPFAAPGTGIYSSFPGNRYREMSGTSMASPHFAGVVAAVLGKKRVNETTLRTCLALSGDAPGDQYMTRNGRINAKKAVDNCTR